MSERWDDVDADEPGWVDGVPTSGTGQSCAFCGSAPVAWVHPLDPDLVRFRLFGDGYTLPTFWTLCEPCEAIYGSGDDEAAVTVMRSSGGWDGDADTEGAEYAGTALAAFRRADKGGRPLTA